jgi:hypothetical protein
VPWTYTAPCCPPPTQVDLAKGGRAFALSVCAVMAHRKARAITPTTTSTAANATVNTSIKSVSMIDLYIVSPCIGQIPSGATVREGQGFTEAQTRQLRQYAWANSRQICDRHNCASNCESLISQDQGVTKFAFTLCGNRPDHILKRSACAFSG